MVEKASNRDRAIELRQQGLSRSQICEALGLKTGGRSLDEWLREVPPPEWTKRPRAKDDLRSQAIKLREEGLSYREIREVIPVSKSTLSLWLQDLPLTTQQHARLADLQVANGRTRGQSNRARRLAAEDAAMKRARAQISDLAESELFVAGLAAYWSEGSKTKPWRTAAQVKFINSDPGLILLFLRWLELLGVERTRVGFRVAIHETADARAAVEHWAGIVNAPPDSFAPTTLKRAKLNPKRHYLQDDYHGCLVVNVSRPTDLYRQIAGWWAALTAQLAS